MNGVIRWRVLAAALGAVLVAPVGCGGGDGSTEISAGEWVDKSDGICAAGTEEAVALPLPTTQRDLIRDARSRAEILSTVRDGLTELRRPEEVDEAALNAYLNELDADIEVMTVAADAIRVGAAYKPLDGSAGTAAGGIGLAGCLTFSDAIGVLT